MAIVEGTAGDVDAETALLAPYSVPTLESRLDPQALEYGGVPRLALVDRLQGARSTPVVSVVAPAGYGKSMLLAQWSQLDQRPFAWLSINERDNDPAALLSRVAAALDETEPMAPHLLQALSAPGATVDAVLPSLEMALAGKALPVVIVLDNLHLLQNPDCLEVVARLASHVPSGSQVVMASRGQPQLSFGALRAEHGVVEFGGDNLAMDVPEAMLLLKDAGVHLPRAEAAELVRRTEGWPVALHLAALELKEDGAAAGQAVPLGGDDRSLGEYVQAAFLSRLPPRLVTFMERVAVLEQLSGPLCDAVLGRTGSARLLESLERAGLLVVPIDRHRSWYRYHPLFRELLLARLRRDEPGMLRKLARRAARWCEDNGRPEAAVGYAMAAGDADHAARLVVRSATTLLASGRIAVLVAWCDWFEERELVDRHPAVAVLGAWAHAQAGDPAAAERWLDAAELAAVEHGSSDGTLPDGSPTIQGWLALVRSMMCRDGIDQMRTDAEVAVALVPAGSPLRSMAEVLLGVACLLAGESDRGDRILLEAIDAGTSTDDAVTLALAERAALAVARGEWTQAEVLAERACSIARRARLEDYPATALLYAVAARWRIHRSDLERAREDLSRVQRLRPRVTYALPFHAAQTRLELVRAHIALTDIRAARAVLVEVEELLERRPDLGVVAPETDKLRAQLDAMHDKAIGAALTAAELRLLHLLGTHYSFREIGDQLYLSRHTVKSHAMSIYRKFGVTSRSEAIQHARGLGLLTE